MNPVRSYKANGVIYKQNMKTSNGMNKKILGLGVFLGLFALTSTALANHAWGNYHWARTANPFELKLGDNMTPAWDSYLRAASTDWSLSNVLDTTVVVGGSNPKNCKAILGRVEVCNSKYGNNGWLGIAQIWVNGDHIVQAVTKMNDTYFARSPYNTASWKQFVICQEIGHAFGLDHQDENFDNPNLGTCMDYTSNPAINQHPNAHDYEELETIYAHFDSNTTALSQSAANNRNLIDLDDSSEWGKSLRNDERGRESVFEKDLGHERKVFTFVVWAERN